MSDTKPKKEIVSIHIGQAGVQIGNAFWELICKEHGLNKEGYSIVPNDYTYSFFREEDNKKFTPRAVFIDTDPVTINKIKLSEHRNLFGPKHLIAGRGSCSSNFARGHYTLGKQILEQSMNSIRQVVEENSNLDGFLIFNSFNGGCSGFNSLLAENLSKDYGKKTKIEIAIMPSPNLNSSILESYNTAFQYKACMDHIDCTIPIENESVFNACEKNIFSYDLTYNNINKIIAQLSSRITSSLRYDSTLNRSMNEIVENLIQFPKIKHIISTYSPINLTETFSTHTELTDALFEPDNQLNGCDAKNGRYLNICTIYRGKDIIQNEVNEAIDYLKSSNGSCFRGANKKAGIVNYRQYSNYEDHNNMSACILSTNTAFHESIQKLRRLFERFYSSRTHVHSYLGENMEEAEFTEAKENLSALLKEYRRIENQVEVY